MKLKISLALPLCILTLLLASCGSSTGGNEGRPRVTTTIAPVADIIDRLVGDAVDVHVLLTQGNTPENYEPRPQDLIDLGESKAYLYVGNLGFETAWIDRIRDIYPKVSLVRLDEGLGQAFDEHHHDEHIHDPHYWMSFRGMQIMASNVARALRGLLPERGMQIDSALSAFNAELESYTGAESILCSDGMPRGFVIYHPSLTYYAEEMGLHQLVIEQDGKEPSARHIETLIQEAKRLGVRYVLLQQEFNPDLTETIAKEIGAQTIVINSLSRDWIDELKRIHKLLLEE